MIFFYEDIREILEIGGQNMKRGKRYMYSVKVIKINGSVGNGEMHAIEMLNFYLNNKLQIPANLRKIQYNIL